MRLGKSTVRRRARTEDDGKGKAKEKKAESKEIAEKVKLPLEAKTTVKVGDKTFSLGGKKGKR